MQRILIIFFLFTIVFSGCDSRKEKTLKVKASAYNTVTWQTNANPKLTYWEDTLKPGMKAIAVSHDLIDSGLTHGTMVEIEGLSGKYKVLDKMDDRWKKRIDIHMGTNVDSAREWGVQEVMISWKENDE